MKVVQKMPSIHIPIQKPDGSMEWVWYMFLQWLSEHLEDTDLSDYFTKEEINEMLTDYALDDGVVHKAGTETITGNKNFTGTNDFYKVNFSTAPTTAVPSFWGAVIKAKASFITSNYDVPGEGQYWQTQGVDVTANDNSYLSWSSTSRYSDGSTNYSICVRARADAESPNKDASMGIRVWPDGTSLTFAPNPAYSSNNNTIATTYWVRNLITTSTDLVHRTGDETINGIKTFNAEIKGRLRSASCHTGPDNTNCWYKLGEFKSRGGYNTHLVLFRAWVGVNGTQADGLVCGRIVTRTGSSGAGSEGRLTEGRIVFDTKPAWLDLNNFVILYKNDQTDDTGDYVQIEFWARTYSAYNGYTFSIFDERAGGEAYNPLWTFYNLPSGVADLPTGYTGQATSQAPNNTNTNVVHISGNETIDGYKTFSAPITAPYIYLGPQSGSSSSIEGGEINFKGGAAEPNASKNVIIDRYNGMIRIFGTDSNDVTKTVLQANIETGTLKGVVPTEDTTSSVQLDTVGARNTKLQSYQPLLTAGSNISISGNTISATDTTYSVMTGATSSTAGTSGLVPAPASGDNDKFLKGDGTWGTVTSSSYHPDLFDTKWSDHIVNDIQWLRADTFSWQGGAVYEAAYQHLADDINGKTLQSETVDGTTIQFYLADDGHKICPASEESNVAAIYAATGVAWYYIIDTTNQRFKLPRRHSQQIIRSVKNVDGSWYRLYADGWVEQGGYVATSSDVQKTISLLVQMDSVYYDVQIQREYASSPGATNANLTAMCVWSLTTTEFKCWDKYGTSIGIHWQVSGQSAIDVSSFQDSKKHLYFYVGNFTQTAIENTAGLNAELFNGKLDTATFMSNTSLVTASDIANSVLTTVDIRKQGTGHVKLGNGIIIQWGDEAGTGTRRQQILSTAFTTNNYFVNVIFAGSVSTALYLPCIDPLTMTTTTFDVITNGNANNVGFRWIAIGW